MIKLSLNALNALASGIKPVFTVKVHFQEPEIYTEDNFLQSPGTISTSISREGGYSIANSTIELNNVGFYFSEKFEKELPNEKLVEIFVNVAGESKVIFRGTVSSWTLTPLNLTLNVNA